MNARDPGSLESASRRAISETIADGRHEYQRAASLPARIRATVHFALALSRVLVMASTRECTAALRSPFAWRWLVVSVTLAAFLPSIHLFGRGFPFERLPALLDVVMAFLFVAPVTLLLVALSGNRSARVPVAGMTTLAAIVFTIALLLGLPLALARTFDSFASGRTFVMPDWLMVLGFGLPCIAFCWCALTLADRARSHARRAFVSSLAILLPITGFLLTMQWRSSVSHGLEIAVVFLAAAIPLAIMSRIIGRPTPSGEVQQ